MDSHLFDDAGSIPASLLRQLERDLLEVGVIPDPRLVLVTSAAGHLRPEYVCYDRQQQIIMTVFEPLTATQTVERLTETFLRLFRLNIWSI